MTERTISRQMLKAVDDAYAGVLAPVLKRHRKTLERLDKLLKAGEVDRASKMWTRSGLLDDLAKAIAGAGAVSADAIRDALARLREAVRNETVRA